jgi:hypothetical protein
MEAPLFSTSGHKAISQSYVLKVVKNACRKAGLNETTMWTHSLRKAFRKVVRQADIDDDDKEQLMGHVIKGSREAYYDKKDADVILEAYRKCNFSREIPKSEVTKLRQQIEADQTRYVMVEAELNNLKAQFEVQQKMLKELLEKKE